jgi:hypothetical protein
VNERCGAKEEGVLRAAILGSVSRELAGAARPPWTILVRVQDLAPRRLSRSQQHAAVSVDPLHSKSIGGAELIGVVSDSQGHVRTSVSHRYCADPARRLATARSLGGCAAGDRGLRRQTGRRLPQVAGRRVSRSARREHVIEGVRDAAQVTLGVLHLALENPLDR